MWMYMYLHFVTLIDDWNQTVTDVVNWGYIGEMFSATKSMCFMSMTACFNARYNIACLYCNMY